MQENTEKDAVLTEQEKDVQKTPDKQKKEPLFGILGTIAISLILNAVLTFGALHYYHQHYAMKIAVMNIGNIVESLKAEFVKGTLTEAQLEKELQLLNERAYNLPPNYLILKRDSVIKGQFEIQEITYGQE